MSFFFPHGVLGLRVFPRLPGECGVYLNFFLGVDRN